MNYPVLYHTKRRLSWKFMAAEALWIMTASNKVMDIAPWNKRIADYSDDGETFFGAYGPKIHNQIYWVAWLLAHDPGTRQAVINIWREDINGYGNWTTQQNRPIPKDVPCSLNLQWLIRNNEIHCIYNMRSSDIWLGWPYDIFNMTMVTIKLLGLIAEIQHQNIPKGESPSYKPAYKLGPLHWSAGSSHLYERDRKKANAILNSRASVPPSRNPVPLESMLHYPNQLEILQTMRHMNRCPMWGTG